MIRLLIILMMLPSLCVASGGMFPCTGGWSYGGGACVGTGTLGNSTGADDGSGGTVVMAYKVTASSDICVTTGYAYSHGTDTGTTYKICIWEDDSGAPGALIAETGEIIAGTTQGYESGTFSTPFQITSGTTYWLGYTASESLYYFYTTSTSEEYYYNDTYSSYPTVPDPYSGSQSSTTTKHVKIYLED